MRRKGVFGSVYCRTHGKRCRGDSTGCRWYVRVRLGGGGKRQDFRKHTGASKSVAEARLAEMRLHLEREENLGVRPPCPTSLEEFLATYLPLLRARVSPVEAAKGEQKLRRAAASLRGPMEEVERRHVEGFLSRLRGEGAKPATCNRYLATISVAWRAAIDRGIAQVNPCRGIRRGREEQKAEHWLSPEALRRIELATPGPARPAVVLASETGLRLSELMRLEWRDVDCARKVLVVRKSKSGKVRSVELSARALEVLGRLPRNGARVLSAGAGYSFLSHGFPDWATAAGEKGATFHDLRHAFGSGLAQSGVPLPDIMRLMGHSSITVTMRYARHAPTDAGAKAIAALERARAPRRRAAGKGSGKGTARSRRSRKRAVPPSRTGS